MRKLGELIGRELTGDTSQKKMAMVRSGKCLAVALPLGAGGVLLAFADGYERLRTPVSIKSKVGAEDNMVAGIVLRLIWGNEVRDNDQAQRRQYQWARVHSDGTHS